MLDYKKIIKNRELRLQLINCLSWIPDEPYLKMVSRIKIGQKLDLKNPKGYNEKQNWLKLHDIHPEYTELVDKLGVRKIIKEQLGEEYLIPLLGSWEKFEDIDFNLLPEQFVLKCSHDSGSVKVIKDKSKMDKDSLRKFFTGRLRLNSFVLGREYPYRKVKPMIIAEKFMQEDGADDLKDYKFLCFNGEPQFVFVVNDRSGTCTMDYYDMNFKRVPMRNRNHANSDVDAPMPTNFELMKDFARQLSKGTRFVRMDFYDINGRVYFGEFTFFDGGGFSIVDPPEWERKLGDMIALEN